MLLPGKSVLEPNTDLSTFIADGGAPKSNSDFHHIPKQKAQAPAGVAGLRHIPPQGRLCLERSTKDEAITVILSSTNTVPKPAPRSSAQSTDGCFGNTVLLENTTGLSYPFFPHQDTANCVCRPSLGLYPTTADPRFDSGPYINRSTLPSYFELYQILVKFVHSGVYPSLGKPRSLPQTTAPLCVGTESGELHDRNGLANDPIPVGSFMTLLPLTSTKSILVPSHRKVFADTPAVRQPTESKLLP